MHLHSDFAIILSVVITPPLTQDLPHEAAA